MWYKCRIYSGFKKYFMKLLLQRLALRWVLMDTPHCHIVCLSCCRRLSSKVEGSYAVNRVLIYKRFRLKDWPVPISKALLLYNCLFSSTLLCKSQVLEPLWILISFFSLHQDHFFFALISFLCPETCICTISHGNSNAHLIYVGFMYLFQVSSCEISMVRGIHLMCYPIIWMQVDGL